MTRLEAMRTDVAAAYQGIAQADRSTLLDVREMIFAVAAENPQIGEVEETLRWGEPSYVTVKKRTGSTIRLSIEKQSGQPALFFDCKTTLVEEFREKFGSDLRYAKNRAVLLDGDVVALGPKLEACIAAALTYHLRK